MYDCTMLLFVSEKMSIHLFTIVILDGWTRIVFQFFGSSSLTQKKDGKQRSSNYNETLQLVRQLAQYLRVILKISGETVITI